MHHHTEHELGLADLEKPCVQGYFAGDVERHRTQLDQMIDQIVLGHRHRSEIRNDLGGIEHHLHRRATRFREYRTQ